MGKRHFKKENAVVVRIWISYSHIEFSNMRNEALS